jgi:hypothetical protein
MSLVQAADVVMRLARRDAARQAELRELRQAAEAELGRVAPFQPLRRRRAVSSSPSDGGQHERLYADAAARRARAAKSITAAQSEEAAATRLTRRISTSASSSSSSCPSASEALFEDAGRRRAAREAVQAQADADACAAACRGRHLVAVPALAGARARVAAFSAAQESALAAVTEVSASLAGEAPGAALLLRVVEAALASRKGGRRESGGAASGRTPRSASSTSRSRSFMSAPLEEPKAVRRGSGHRHALSLQASLATTPTHRDGDSGRAAAGRPWRAASPSPAPATSFSRQHEVHLRPQEPRALQEAADASATLCAVPSVLLRRLRRALRSALTEASYAAARAAYRQQQAEEGEAERGGDVLTRTTTPARAAAHVEGMRSASAAARERMQHSAIEMAAAEMGECTFRPSLSTTGGAKGTRGRGRRLVRRGGGVGEAVGDGLSSVTETEGEGVGALRRLGFFGPPSYAALTASTVARSAAGGHSPYPSVLMKAAIKAGVDTPSSRQRSAARVAAAEAVATAAGAASPGTGSRASVRSRFSMSDFDASALVAALGPIAAASAAPTTLPLGMVPGLTKHILAIARERERLGPLSTPPSRSVPHEREQELATPNAAVRGWQGGLRADGGGLAARGRRVPPALALNPAPAPSTPAPCPIIPRLRSSVTVVSGAPSTGHPPSVGYSARLAYARARRGSGACSPSPSSVGGDAAGGRAGPAPLTAAVPYAIQPPPQLPMAPSTSSRRWGARAHLPSRRHATVRAIVRCTLMATLARDEEEGEMMGGMWGGSTPSPPRPGIIAPPPTPASGMARGAFQSPQPIRMDRARLAALAAPVPVLAPAQSDRAWTAGLRDGSAGLTGTTTADWSALGVRGTHIALGSSLTRRSSVGDGSTLGEESGGQARGRRSSVGSGGHTAARAASRGRGEEAQAAAEMPQRRVAPGAPHLSTAERAEDRGRSKLAPTVVVEGGSQAAALPQALLPRSAAAAPFEVVSPPPGAPPSPRDDAWQLEPALEGPGSPGPGSTGYGGAAESMQASEAGCCSPVELREAETAPPHPEPILFTLNVLLAPGKAVSVSITSSQACKPEETAAAILDSHAPAPTGQPPSTTTRGRRDTEMDAPSKIAVPPRATQLGILARAISAAAEEVRREARAAAKGQPLSPLTTRTDARIA